MKIRYTFILFLSLFMSNATLSLASGIDSLSVFIIECDTINNTYDIAVDFQISDPTVDSVTVVVNWDLTYTFFAGDSIVINGISPRPNTLFEIIQVCDSNNEDCCAALEYLQPDCFGSNNDDCEIIYIEEEIINCDTINGTYDMQIFYDIEDAGNDFIDLWVNNEFIGNFEIGESLFVYDVIPRANSNSDIIKICVNDNPNCCFEYEYFPPNCTGSNDECDIIYIEHEVIACDSVAGTYGVEIFYGIENAGNDFLDLWVNNEYLGSYEIGDSLIVFDITPRTNSNADIIKICVNDNPDCCYEYEYSPPNCSPGNEDCEVIFIEEYIFSCDTINGTYDMQIFYDIQDPGNDFLDLWVNNEFIGTFEIGDSLTVFDITPRVNSNADIIKICVNDHPNCCLEYEYFPPDCASTSDECEVQYIEHELVACDTIANTYDINIFYDIENAGNDFIDLWVNNEFIDSYPIGNTISVDDITPRSNSVYDIIKICVNDNPDCCLEYEFLQPDCFAGSEECEILYIEEYIFSCDSVADTYSMEIFYDFLDPSSNIFEVWVNDIFINDYVIGDSVVVFDITPSPNSDFDIITICINDDEDCCLSYEYLQPDCESLANCQLEVRELEITFCDSTSGHYDMTVLYDLENPSADSISVWVNQQFHGTWDIEQAINLEDIEPNEFVDYDELRMCIGDEEVCCTEFSYLQPICLATAIKNIDIETQIIWMQDAILFKDLKDFQVMISDVSGRKLMEHGLNTEEQTLRLQSLQSGIYIVTVYNQYQALSKKVCVIK